MSAETWYHELAKSMDQDQIDLISQYYQDWDGKQPLNTKFRFMKVFCRDNNDNIGRWIDLHNTINKRRIQQSELADAVREIIEMGLIPIRIFYSTSEWLAPNEMWTNPHHPSWLIKSGFLVLEEDSSLSTSINTANLLLKHISSDPYIVYSGNKSIHLWIPFDFTDYINEKQKQQLGFADKLESLDRKKRTERFEYFDSLLDIELDYRVGIDSRRVIPVINSLNGTTNRKVINLTSGQLKSLSAAEIKDLANYCY